MFWLPLWLDVYRREIQSLYRSTRCVCMCACRHAQDVRELYERKLERANNLYMELCACMLQMEKRERELSKSVSVCLSVCLLHICSVVDFFTIHSLVHFIHSLPHPLYSFFIRSFSTDHFDGPVSSLVVKTSSNQSFKTKTNTTSAKSVKSWALAVSRPRPRSQRLHLSLIHFFIHYIPPSLVYSVLTYF